MSTDLLSDELKKYLANAFSPPSGLFDTLPLPDEEFVEEWNSYYAESRSCGAFDTLKKYLPQLRFPIEKGISSTDAYRSAVSPADGVVPAETPAAGWLELEAPAEIELMIHKTRAGSIPVIIARRRRDFETLCRALAYRNEPEDVPASMGACAIRGYFNRARHESYLRKLSEAPPFDALNFEGPSEQKRHYQDCFILISDGPYSGLPASEAGFGETEWRALSLRIRLAHESAHYFTRRCLGSMRNNAHDELIADYAGICSALGRYDASLFLKFCGISDSGGATPSGRINNYRGSPPLSAPDFLAMCSLLRSAALNLECFDLACRAGFSRGDFTTAAVLCAASLSIDAMAGADGASKLEKALLAI